jgi:hypothetical protein
MGKIGLNHAFRPISKYFMNDIISDLPVRMGESTKRMWKLCGNVAGNGTLGSELNKNFLGTKVLSGKVNFFWIISTSTSPLRYYCQSNYSK